MLEGGSSFISSIVSLTHSLTHSPFTMPPSNIIRGSIFAAGLLVGVGAGGAIFAKRERNPSGSSQVVEQGISPSAAKEKGRNGSVVEVEDRRVVLTGHQTNQVSAQILKHGFPGTFFSGYLSKST